MIRMTVEDEFPGVFDGNEALPLRNLPDQSLRPGRLSRACRPRDEDVLAASDGETHEVFKLTRCQQPLERALRVIERLIGAARPAEDPARRELRDAPYLVRGPAYGNGDAPRRGGRRYDELNPLARRQRRRQQR